MAGQNFAFRENFAGSEVAGMKIVFLTFFTQLGPTFWPQKAEGLVNKLLSSGLTEFIRYSHQIFYFLLFLLELDSTLSDKKIFVTNFPFLTYSLKAPDFQWNMLGDSIGINKLFSNSFEKKKGKTYKIAIFRPNLHKKGVNITFSSFEDSKYYCFYSV